MTRWLLSGSAYELVKRVVAVVDEICGFLRAVKAVLTVLKHALDRATFRIAQANSKNCYYRNNNGEADNCVDHSFLSFNIYFNQIDLIFTVDDPRSVYNCLYRRKRSVFRRFP